VPAVITPRISPNGDRVMAVLGLFGEGGFQSQQLLVMPAREAGVQQAATLATGQVRSPAWSPGGDLIAFIEDLESGASLVRMNSSGGDRTVLSEEGDYAAPVFSPQLPAGE
jgi:Tol biopolymer transport system component